MFILPADPDGRLTAVRWLKQNGQLLNFTLQEPGTLAAWIRKRFQALGKDIRADDAQYLIFLCGAGMQGLIPEIEKAAAYARGDCVTRSEIDATANRLPEAEVWTMTDQMSQRRFDAAAATLGDLLSDKANHPILLAALMGQQARRMYAAKLGQSAGRSRRDVMELCGIRFDFVYEKLVAAIKPYSLRQLGDMVKLCAEYDYRMKSTGVDAEALIRELFARLAAGV